MAAYEYVCDDCKERCTTLADCVGCSSELCWECAERDGCKCRSCVAAAKEFYIVESPPDLRGLAERDQPSTPAPPAGAVTDLRQTLDAQLVILGELFDQAVAPNVTMRRKTQAVDQFRIALRFVRMLATKE